MKINGVNVINNPLEIKECIDYINRVTGGEPVKAEYNSLVNEQNFICRIEYFDGTDDISLPDKNGVSKEVYLRLPYDVEYDDEDYPEIILYFKGLRLKITDENYMDIRDDLEMEFTKRYQIKESEDIER